MQFRKEYNMRGNPFNSIWSILMIILALVTLYFLARAIFQILYYLSPVLLIAALVINYRVVLDYIKWVGSLYRQHIGLGIGATLLSIFGFPIVSVFLFGKALFQRKLKQAEEAYERENLGELADYEELDSSPLELPELEKKREQPKSDNEYENLF